ncbi:site-specific DNA-methyltransferase [Bradyrhizobium elkanii]|uniref:site-specific DNA-methyltransferase n=1 Tax=Bradyrhizobium elkanii TaxID=29448 RepID=UPI0027151571|nr:site-specific DNA-methyltransferase [Bradyrhizobium elkanii]WLA99876.1 site-specific DNA-methyltransferase [Bradyrhizobium elkanii]
MGRNGGARLELTWIGKNDRPRLEPRILIEDAEKSYHATTKREADIFDNMLVQGDNLLALKALESDYAGKVKCVYIDPPFNTKQAFENYDDGLEHSLWLSLMRDRIRIIHRLLSAAGSLFIHIDDNELGYLIALTDEIFGRSNRVSVITFKQSSASGPKAINPGIVTTNNYILYYVKDKSAWKPNRVYVKSERDDRYTKFIENISDDYGKWSIVGLREAFLAWSGLSTWKAARQHYSDKLEEALSSFVLNNADRVIRTARVAPKDVNENAREALAKSLGDTRRVYRSERAEKEDYYFINGEQLIFYKQKTKEVDGELTTASPLTNLWDDLLSNNLHAEGGVSFPNGKKPEALIKRCLELSTERGDLVLDSFAGSGTTGAVAHKMGRRWIMIELGPHAVSHVIPRLRAVVDGDDRSGVTEATGWRGGGGFRFYHLAPSLLEKDKWGNWVIAKAYNAAMLAEAMCRHMGFTYEPSQDVAEYWKHGHSSERDFIFVTTASLTHDQLKAISHDVRPDRTLLICCKAFNARLDDFENLTVTKIPHAILNRCEWGRDDYSLEIADLPPRALDRGNGDGNGNGHALNGRKRGRGKAADSQPTLFGEGEA